MFSRPPFVYAVETLHVFYPPIIISLCTPLELPHFSIVIVDQVVLEHAGQWRYAENAPVFRISKLGEIDWGGKHIFSTFHTKLDLP